jgi:hypothetical protein
MMAWFRKQEAAEVDTEAAWAARMERNAQRPRAEKSAMERVWDELANVTAAHDVVCYGVD